MICLSSKEKDLLFFQNLPRDIKYIELRLDLEFYPFELLKNILKLDFKFILKINPKNIDINRLLALPFTYIDIDYSFIRGMNDNIIDKLSSGFIISYHNFKTTPGRAELEEIFINIQKYSPEIIKIVVFSNSEEDNNNILNLYKYCEPNKLLAFAMGEIGRETRILSLQHGAPWMYVSFDKDSNTASGQLTLNEALEYLKENKIGN